MEVDMTKRWAKKLIASPAQAGPGQKPFAGPIHQLPKAYKS
ncbi:hypothetical protein ACQP2X_17410 [Actinoplanes sp. CA-131856]